MRINFLNLARLLFFIIGFARSGVAEDVFLYSIKFGEKFDGTEPKRYSFFVQSTQLTQKTTWQPGTQLFPLELDSAARDARSVLAGRTGETNAIDLSEITIRRLVLPQNVQGVPGRNDQWFVFFRFLVQQQPDPQARCVVMLLDGSLAREIVGSFREIGLPGSSVIDRSRLSAVHSGQVGEPSSQRNLMKGESAGQKIERSDFVIPQTQWEPYHEKFPLDLSSQVASTARWLLKLVDRPAFSPQLTEISIQNFVPFAAINSHGLDLLKNRSHWLVEFKYESQSITFAAFELLDGRLIQAVEEPIEQK